MADIINVSDLLDDYKYSDLSVTEIAVKYKTSRELVLQLKEEYGIKLKPRGPIGNPCLRKHEDEIIEHYKSYDMSVKNIAEEYKTSEKSIARVAKEHGVIRDISEARIMASIHRDYTATRNVMENRRLHKKRKTITHKTRKEVKAKYNNRCAICNGFVGDGITYQMEIDHIDNNCENNSINNLWLLCDLCNKRKYLAFLAQINEAKRRNAA